MKILITGVSGFVGSHVAEWLLQEGYDEIWGSIRWRSDRKNIKHLDGLKLYECDIRDAFAVRTMIESIMPDWIVHLAAQSYVPFSWKAPQETISTNVNGEVNVFEAVRQARAWEQDYEPLIHIAGSSEEYGRVLPDEVPITESNPLRPLSPYAVSKVAQDLLGYQYFQSYKLQIIRTRAFNHTGPRRGDVFVTSNFAKQLVEIEMGIRDPVMYVGNLQAIRDFTDVRDVARAYVMALDHAVPGDVYNIASGKGRKIEEVLNQLIILSGVTVDVKQDPKRMRPSDVELLIGSAEKFKERTGWDNVIPFDQTLQDLLDYWRVELKGEVK